MFRSSVVVVVVVRFTRRECPVSGLDRPWSDAGADWGLARGPSGRPDDRRGGPSSWCGEGGPEGTSSVGAAAGEVEGDR